MTAYLWKSGPPVEPGLYALDRGPATEGDERIVVRHVDPTAIPHLLTWVKAHLAIPEPPKLQSIKVTIPLPQNTEPFNLPAFLRDNPNATLETLTETLAKLGVRELEIPPELEGHPLVKAAIQAIHGREVSFLDLQQTNSQQSPNTGSIPQAPSGFRPGQMVEVHTTGQNGEPQWYRAIYVHYKPNGEHYCRINTGWHVDAADHQIRQVTP